MMTNGSTREILNGFTEEEFLWLRTLLTALAEQQKERREEQNGPM